MSRLVAFALVLGGCNYILGLEHTELIDAAVPSDGPRLFVPPDGTTSCAPAPDFESWTYTTKTLTGVTGDVLHPSFVAEDRVVFTIGGKLYESMLDGNARAVDELELDLIDIVWPAAAPGTELVWFVRVPEMAVPLPEVGNYVARRDAGMWTAQRAELGVSGYQIEVGSVGFFAGEARMVIGVTPNMMERMRLVELASHDGITWKRLDTFPFSTGDVVDFDPSLSADGCMVFYTRSGAIQVAERGADGNFGAPKLLTAATGGVFATTAALAPSRTRLWLKRGSMLVEGRP